MIESTCIHEAVQRKKDWVRERLEDAIRRGDFRPGERMPSEKQLARLLSVNHRTVRAGLELLAQRDIVVRRPRSGTYVTKQARQALSTQIAIALPDFLLKAENSSQVAISTAIRTVGRVFAPGESVTPVMFYRPGRLLTDVARPAASRGVRGLLLWPQFEPLSTWRADLKTVLKEGFHVAITDSLPGDDFSGLDVFAVHVEVLPALTRIFERAIELGHRRIVALLYSSPERIRHRFEKEIQRLAALYRLDKSVDHVLVLDNVYPRSADYNVINSLLDQPQRPTAIVVEDEVMAAAVWRACNHRRLHVPHDISVAALWDMTPGAHPVRMTCSNTVELWERAAELGALYLNQRLTNGDYTDGGLQTEMTAQVVWQESLGPMHGQDKR